MNQRLIQGITDFIFVEDQPRKADIILLPGGSRAEVPEKAAELYKAGLAPLILPSGRFAKKNGRFLSENVTNPRYQGDWRTEWDFYRAVLQANGVPDAAILCEDRATNTLENAEYSAALLREKGIEIHSALLVCKATHARRALMSYLTQFPGLEVIVVPAVADGLSRDSWFRSELGYRKVMSEVAKCGRYFADMGYAFADFVEDEYPSEAAPESEQAEWREVDEK